MPFPQRPPATPEENPTGVYERSFELPAGWAGRRVVLHVGAAESVLLVTLNGLEVGISKDSHLAAEFDVTSVVRAGVQRPPADGGEVVRRLVHRGPGPVVARRHHAAGVPVRDRADLPRGPRDRRRPRRRSRHRDGQARGRRGLPGRSPGGRLAGRGDGRGPRRAAARDHRQRAAARAGPRRLGRPRPTAPWRARPREPQRRGRADRPRRPRALAAGGVARAPAADRTRRSWRPGSRA